MPEDHVTREEFLQQFFGNWGRELADPNQWFTNNPNDIFEHIETCRKDKKPAFISVQPRVAHDVVLGIEKIFWDFDYGRKSDKLTETQIAKKKEELKKEVIAFVNNLFYRHKITPLIIKTNKGYHVHVYFDKVKQITDDYDYWGKVYKEIHDRFVHDCPFNGGNLKYVDSTSEKDIKRLCRIPLSWHQKDDSYCDIVDVKLNATKIRGISRYTMDGLKDRHLKSAIDLVDRKEQLRREKMAKEQVDRKDNWEMNHGFTGRIRPCFSIRMEGKEMVHQQRLALLIEAYYAGHRTREAMMNVFSVFNDYDGDNSGSVCKTQVDWFFDNVVDEAKKKCKTNPYKCSTIQGFGWCLEDKCDIYRRRKIKNEKS